MLVLFGSLWEERQFTSGLMLRKFLREHTGHMLRVSERCNGNLWEETVLSGVIWRKVMKRVGGGGAK